MTEILPYLTAALLYGALAIYYWRTCWAPAGVTVEQPSGLGAEHYVVLVPLALHTVLLDAIAQYAEKVHTRLSIEMKLRASFPHGAWQPRRGTSEVGIVAEPD